MMDPALLKLLLQRAAERRDDAARRAATARRERDGADRTLRSLKDYRDESLGRGPARGGAAMGIEQLRAAGRFDGRLLEAITQQHLQWVERSREAGTRDAELLERQRRLKALQTLAERRERAALALAARREQRGTDEHALQLSRRRAPDEDPT
jgi:flagellar FliJ protein